MNTGEDQSAQIEEAILEQGRRIRALHDIIARPDLSFDEQIDECLRLGCKLLGTEVGKVGRQDPENNISEFLNTVVMSDLPAKRGVKIPLDKTYCNITFSSPETIALHDVEHSQFKDHPAVNFLGMHTYIGCSIDIHGKKFGTVNFSNRTPREKPFSEADKDLVNLIASWISIMMERSLEAKELRRSKEEAERANQAKSIFLANTSHEIRTPLTAIIGFSEIALDDDQTTEQRVAALQTIYGSSKHLLSLINDILDLSKIEAGEFEVEKEDVDVITVLNEVISIVSDHARRKGIALKLDIEFPVPKVIQTDPLRLKQILLNLSSNAVKFTEEGGVKLQVLFDHAENKIHFNVIDTGIGLTQEQLEKVFKPFKQADSGTSRRYGGTGLGLSLSKHMTELLGGELTATSTYGQGSCFSTVLQLDQVDTSRLIESQQDLDAIKETIVSQEVPVLNGRILVVDDTDLNQLLVQRFLEKTGAEIVLADNGATALSLALKKPFDLIFMDMQMPIMSGIDAVTMLRNEGYDKPIVMLTANVSTEDRKRCEQAGSNDFLTKPIIREELFEMAKRYFKK